MAEQKLNIPGERRVETLVWYPEQKLRVRTTVHYFGQGTKARGICEINGSVYNVRYTGIWRVI